MKLIKTLLVFVVLAPHASAVPAFAQLSRKPELIRDTDAAEGKTEPDVEAPKEYNPLLAEKNIDIGNFYFRKKNYVAAIQRYLEAMEYQPNSTEACEALAEAYEKNGQISKAVDAYKDFLNKHPDTPRSPDFRARIEKLEKEQQ